MSTLAAALTPFGRLHPQRLALVRQHSHSETDLGVLLVNTTADSFEKVDVTSYDVETGKTVVSLPSAGTYLFVSFKSAAYVPAKYGRKLKHEGSGAANKTYRYGNDFAMQFNSSASTMLDVLRYTSVNATLSTKARGFASFKLEQSANAQFNASLVYAYSKSEVEGAGYKVENLGWWTYDEATKAWVKVPSVVNVESSTVVATTAHFSEWTIAASMSGAFGRFGVPAGGSFVAVLFAIVAGSL
ncbi:hypothetical protein HDV00_009804 [Rhizophlyctis rosea]|nr:hypothetical protein HDV00_009804 [Rhizophlyctis rosea]